jgi:biotin operon repressor
MKSCEVYGLSYSRVTVSRVWALVTAEPSLSGDEVAGRLGIHRSTAYNCLAWLNQQGYVVAAGNRAREIAVPCFTDWRVVPAPAHPGVNATEAR